MSFHHHHHHRRNDDDDDDSQNYPPPPSNFSSFDNPPPPPPPSFFGGEAPPPPSFFGEAPPPPPSFYGGDEPPPPPRPYASQVHHTSHEYNPPQFQSDSFDHNYSSDAPPPPRVPAYAPPPDSAATVHHVSHEVDSYEEPHHSHRPHLPSFLHHQSDSSGSTPSNKPTFKIFPKANPNFSLTIRDGTVILAPSNPNDDYQRWYKDEKFSTKVKDEEGFPAFSLVNKVTGEAIKHSIGATHPVRLVPYKSDYLDESVLWTQSKEIKDGYRTIRMVNNVHLNVDAFHGDEKSGGVHDGTTIVLWKWNKGDNQLWKITPY